MWHAGFPDLPERGDPGYTKWTLCGTNEVKRLAFILEGINPQMTKKTILAMVALEEEITQNQKGAPIPDAPNDLEA